MNLNTYSINLSGSRIFRAAGVGLCVCAALAANATPVALQNATATYSQTADSLAGVGIVINGAPNNTEGWGVSPFEGVNQTAAFQTVQNVGFAGGSRLTFTLDQFFTLNLETLGDFRISVTTDDRSTFANGLITGGDVTANWTVLNPISAVSQNGTTLTIEGDGSVLASGASPATDIYTIEADTALTGITGFRLEALANASLPHNGPGRQPLNGNFTLSQFGVDITPYTVPEPATCALALVGGGLAWLRRRGTRA